MRLLFGLLLVVSFVGCDATVESDLLGFSAWKLISGSQATGASVHFEDGSFRARPVCNTVFGSYSLGRRQIGVSVQGSTRAYCGKEGMAAEADFTRALERVTRYELREDRLTLTGRSTRLVFEKQ